MDLARKTSASPIFNFRVRGSGRGYESQTYYESIGLVTSSTTLNLNVVEALVPHPYKEMGVVWARQPAKAAINRRTPRATFWRRGSGLGGRTSLQTDYRSGAGQAVRPIRLRLPWL